MGLYFSGVKETVIRLVRECGRLSKFSTTDQRGALNWRHKFRKAVEPIFGELYKSRRTREIVRLLRPEKKIKNKKLIFF